MNTRKFIFIVVTALTAFLVVVCGVAAATAEIYPRAGRVVEINKDLVVFVDGAGLTWEYEGVEDLEVGDPVCCIFHDAGTPESIFDDEVLTLQYAGIF